MTDWNKEADQLGTSNFWKPETGQYKIRFVDDGAPATFEDKKSGRISEQVNFTVELEGEEKIWTVTKARTVNSLYGQIALLGRHHGSMVGREITLLVKFDQKNNKREYTVQEALPLITDWNRKQERKRKAEHPQDPFQKTEVEPFEPLRDTKMEEPQGSSGGSPTLERAFEKAQKEEISK